MNFLATLLRKWRSTPMLGRARRFAAGRWQRVRYARRVRESGIFDEAHYISAYPDVVSQGVDPLKHFLVWGGFEGRDPHPLFDASFYLAANPEVAQQGMNPLIHYLREGAAEGRSPHPRFDNGFYLEQCGGELPESSTPLTHYLRVGRPAGLPVNARQRLRVKLGVPCEPVPELEEKLCGSGFFDATFYREQLRGFHEVRGDALRHFLEIGAVEGFAFRRKRDLVARLRTLDLDSPGRPELAYLRGADSAPDVGRGQRIAVHVSSEGNDFFHEMAQVIAAGFSACGADARVLDENAPPAPDAEHEIVVAPHEFFLLGSGPRRLTRDFLARAHLWIAEQPGSEFFAMCMWFARFARMVLDVNPLCSLAWAEMGFRARAFPLGYLDGFAEFEDHAELGGEWLRYSQPRAVRDYAGSVDDPLTDRPIDVFCNAVLTRRRERFFARNAAIFGDLRCALFLPSPSTPISAKLASALQARDATALAQRSKIVLNVHRDETPYFEWHRIMVRGAWQKALVVSEPCLPVPGFEPGVHYIEATARELPQKLLWLLRTAEGRATAEAVRKRAYETFVERFAMPRLASAFLLEHTGGAAQ